VYRTGQRDLELAFGGRLSPWYYESARQNMGPMIRSFLQIYGPDALVESLSDAYWFDCLAKILGLEKMGSGSTTVLTAILKEVLGYDDGVVIVGGKSLRAFKVPAELDQVAYVFNLSSKQLQVLKYSSRMTAKVDSAAIQDNFSLYQHVMAVSLHGNWSVVQQGRNPISGMARRYHWSCRRITETRSYVDTPHKGIVSDVLVEWVLDMTAKESAESRKACVDLVKESPAKLRRFRRPMKEKEQTSLLDWVPSEGPTTPPPKLLPSKIDWRLIERLKQQTLENFEQLLAVKGVGKMTVRFLALTAQALYGVSPSFTDPAMLEQELEQSCRERYLSELKCRLLESVRNASIPGDRKRVLLNRIGPCAELAG